MKRGAALALALLLAPGLRAEVFTLRPLRDGGMAAAPPDSMNWFRVWSSGENTGNRCSSTASGSK
ncbi:MAG: hypothetical protein L6W00_08595 [Lentisphaeria bacterium]|nr:MAG: hypothetical protein L6W00_08595 [Lentisphaeria bacterium]